MKVVCVEKFEGVWMCGGTYPASEIPVVGNVYTVINSATLVNGKEVLELQEFSGTGMYNASKFRPITTEDFRWESIDEVLQNVNSEVAISKPETTTRPT